MVCKKCGELIPSGRSRCPNCGALREGLKFCQHCGEAIDKECVVCPKCGKQVAELKQAQSQPSVYINNTNTNVNRNTMNAYPVMYGRMKNKWVALLLCIFFGGLGAHKFYEGKIGMGILYLFTMGIFCIGWLVDILILLFKPNPYYV